MRVKMSFKQKGLRDKYRKLAAEYVKQVGKDFRDLVYMGASFAKSIAPRKTGSLAASIFPRASRGVYEISFRHPRGKKYPYHVWWNDPNSKWNKLAAKYNWVLTGLADRYGFLKNQTKDGTRVYVQNVARSKYENLSFRVIKRSGF